MKLSNLFLVKLLVILLLTVTGSFEILSTLLVVVSLLDFLVLESLHPGFVLLKLLIQQVSHVLLLLFCVVFFTSEHELPAFLHFVLAFAWLVVWRGSWPCAIPRGLVL